MKRTQSLIHKKLIARGCAPEVAESLSAEMIDQGYLAKDLDTFAMPSIEVLREQSAVRNRSDSGASEEDFEIAQGQARFAMRDLPAGMTYGDLLEVGTDVIMFERRGDGSALHGKDLERAISRRIVRNKKRWRRRNSITAPGDDADQSWEPENWALQNGERVFAPRPSRADDPADRWEKLDKILPTLTRVQQQMLILILCGEKQAEAARIAGVSQSTVSDLLAKLRARSSFH